MSLILLANVSNEIRSDDVLKKKNKQTKKKTTGNKLRSGACKRDSDREINPAFSFDESVLQLCLAFDEVQKLFLYLSLDLSEKNN